MSSKPLKIGGKRANSSRNCATPNATSLLQDNHSFVMTPDKIIILLVFIPHPSPAALAQFA
jgi:hypothetical protein